MLEERQRKYIRHVVYLSLHSTTRAALNARTWNTNRHSHHDLTLQTVCNWTPSKCLDLTGFQVRILCQWSPLLRPLRCWIWIHIVRILCIQKITYMAGIHLGALSNTRYSNNLDFARVLWQSQRLGVQGDESCGPEHAEIFEFVRLKELMVRSFAIWHKVEDVGYALHVVCGVVYL